MRFLRRLRDDPIQLLGTLATVNLVIWIISMIAMIILIQDAPAVKKLAPILMSGVAAGSAVISVIPRLRE